MEMLIGCIVFQLCCEYITPEVVKCDRFCQCIDITNISPDTNMLIQSSSTIKIISREVRAPVTIVDQRQEAADSEQLCVPGAVVVTLTTTIVCSK